MKVCVLLCLAGAEYAGVAASERLFSAKSRLQHVQDRCQVVDAELKKLELQTIKDTAEHAEKERKKTEEQNQEEQTANLESENPQ